MSRRNNSIVLKSRDHDLTILVGEEETPYTYYSMFLAARAPLIDVMLSHDMKEKNEMVIRFPDISVNDWEILEPFIYPNANFQVQTNAHYGLPSSDVETVEILLPLALRFQLKELQQSLDGLTTRFSKTMVDFLDMLAKYGTENLPKTSSALTNKIRKGRYDVAEVSPELAEKLLNWSEMDALWELFETSDCIPPWKGKKIDVARKTHGDDNALLVLLLYYILADDKRRNSYADY